MRPIIFLNLHVNMVDDMQLTQSLLASYTWMYLSSIKQRDPDFPVSCFLLFWFYCIAAEISSQYSDHTLTQFVSSAHCPFTQKCDTETLVSIRSRRCSIGTVSLGARPLAGSCWDRHNYATANRLVDKYRPLLAWNHHPNE